MSQSNAVTFKAFETYPADTVNLFPAFAVIDVRISRLAQIYAYAVIDRAFHLCAILQKPFLTA